MARQRRGISPEGITGDDADQNAGAAPAGPKVENPTAIQRRKRKGPDTKPQPATAIGAPTPPDNNPPAPDPAHAAPPVAPPPPDTRPAPTQAADRPQVLKGLDREREKISQKLSRTKHDDPKFDELLAELEKINDRIEELEPLYEDVKASQEAFLQARKNTDHAAIKDTRANFQVAQKKLNDALHPPAPPTPTPAPTPVPPQQPGAGPAPTGPQTPEAGQPPTPATPEAQLKATREAYAKASIAVEKAEGIFGFGGQKKIDAAKTARQQALETYQHAVEAVVAEQADDYMTETTKMYATMGVERAKQKGFSTKLTKVWNWLGDQNLLRGATRVVGWVGEKMGIGHGGQALVDKIKHWTEESAPEHLTGNVTKTDKAFAYFAKYSSKFIYNLFSGRAMVGMAFMGTGVLAAEAGMGGAALASIIAGRAWGAVGGHAGTYVGARAFGEWRHRKKQQKEIEQRTTAVGETRDPKEELMDRLSAIVNQTYLSGRDYTHLENDHGYQILLQRLYEGLPPVPQAEFQTRMRELTEALQKKRDEFGARNSWYKGMSIIGAMVVGTGMMGDVMYGRRIGDNMGRLTDSVESYFKTGELPRGGGAVAGNGQHKISPELGGKLRVQMETAKLNMDAATLKKLGVSGANPAEFSVATNNLAELNSFTGKLPPELRLRLTQAVVAGGLETGDITNLKHLFNITEGNPGAQAMIFGAVANAGHPEAVFGTLKELFGGVPTKAAMEQFHLLKNQGDLAAVLKAGRSGTLGLTESIRRGDAFGYEMQSAMDEAFKKGDTATLKAFFARAGMGDVRLTAGNADDLIHTATLKIIKWNNGAVSDAVQNKVHAGNRLVVWNENGKFGFKVIQGTSGHVATNVDEHVFLDAQSQKLGVKLSFGKGGWTELVATDAKGAKIGTFNAGKYDSATELRAAVLEAKKTVIAPLPSPEVAPTQAGWHNTNAGAGLEAYLRSKGIEMVHPTQLKDLVGVEPSVKISVMEVDYAKIPSEAGVASDGTKIYALDYNANGKADRYIVALETTGHTKFYVGAVDTAMDEPPVKALHKVIVQSETIKHGVTEIGYATKLPVHDRIQLAQAMGHDLRTTIKVATIDAMKMFEQKLGNHWDVLKVGGKFSPDQLKIAGRLAPGYSGEQLTKALGGAKEMPGLPLDQRMAAAELLVIQKPKLVETILGTKAEFTSSGAVKLLEGGRLKISDLKLGDTGKRFSSVIINAGGLEKLTVEARPGGFMGGPRINESLTYFKDRIK